jgi:hypothetical protein
MQKSDYSENTVHFTGHLQPTISAMAKVEIDQLKLGHTVMLRDLV